MDLPYAVLCHSTVYRPNPWHDIRLWTLQARTLCHCRANEQNTQAVLFYRHMGFEVVGRIETDGQGKHFLGIRPVKPGYAEWEAAPCLGGLKWMKGDVPTPGGNIHLEMTPRKITVKADGCGGGTLLFKSRKRPKALAGVAEALGNGSYRLRIEPGQTVSVTIG